jgi:hypothetical protein
MVAGEMFYYYLKYRELVQSGKQYFQEEAERPHKNVCEAVFYFASSG